MKKLLMLTLLIFTACSPKTAEQAAQTAQDRYVALNNTIALVADKVSVYVLDCKTKPVTDPCRAKLPAINTAGKNLIATMHETDKVFDAHNAVYYETALIVAQNAINDVKALTGQ